MRTALPPFMSIVLNPEKKFGGNDLPSGEKVALKQQNGEGVDDDQAGKGWRVLRDDRLGMAGQDEREGARGCCCCRMVADRPNQGREDNVRQAQSRRPLLLLPPLRRRARA